MASDGKSKGRDIINGIRPLTRIDNERRPATAAEKQALVLLSGFGAVALSIFPAPVTGRYKDASRQLLGEELRSPFVT